MKRESACNVEGTLIYDPIECRSEDLRRVRAALDSAGVIYNIREASDIHTEGSIAFDFLKRRASGHYNLGGAEILSFANDVRERRAA